MFAGKDGPIEPVQNRRAAGFDCDVTQIDERARSPSPSGRGPTHVLMRGVRELGDRQAEALALTPARASTLVGPLPEEGEGEKRVLDWAK